VVPRTSPHVGIMKVIINTCFGGYGLSDEAVQAYAKAKGLTLFSDTSMRWRTGYSFVLVDQGLDFHARFSPDYDIPRDDPTLVDVLETLGAEKCSGRFAALKVVEIPDGTEYTIEEYDGMEHIAEVHNTWS